MSSTPELKKTEVYDHVEDSGASSHGNEYSRNVNAK